MKSEFWSVFEATGRVEDYLRYKGETSTLTDKKEGQEQLSQRKRTSEEAVWEKPLR